MKIPLNLNEIQESRPVPNGKYHLIVASAEEKKSQKGSPMIVCSLGISGHEDAPNVSHYISLPDGSDPTKDNFKALMLKRFLHAFNIAFDESGFDMDDFIGADADADLTLSEPDDSGNVYNRLQLPKLPSEGNEGTVKKASTAAKPPKR